MSIVNYWKQFENTGKVEDYLAYASNREEVSGTVGASTMGASAMSTVTMGASVIGTSTDAWEGVRPYAGICVGDGNSIETDSCR